MTRDEHLQFCKERALRELAFYFETGKGSEAPANAFASMASDLEKHPETANHGAIKLGLLMLIHGQLDSPSAMAEFIRGFN